MGVLFKEPLSSEACLGRVEAAAFHHTYLRAGNMKNGGGQGITESQHLMHALKRLDTKEGYFGKKTLQFLQVSTSIHASCRITEARNGGVEVEGGVLITDIRLLRLISQHAHDAAWETVDRSLNSSSCLCFEALEGQLRPVQTATTAAQPGERRWSLEETFDWLRVSSRVRGSARSAAKNNRGVEVEGDVHIKDDWLLRLISRHAPDAASEMVDRLLNQ